MSGLKTIATFLFAVTICVCAAVGQNKYRYAECKSKANCHFSDCMVALVNEPQCASGKACYTYICGTFTEFRACVWNEKVKATCPIAPETRTCSDCQRWGAVPAQCSVQGNPCDAAECVAGGGTPVGGNITFNLC